MYILHKYSFSFELIAENQWILKSEENQWNYGFWRFLNFHPESLEKMIPVFWQKRFAFWEMYGKIKNKTHHQHKQVHKSQFGFVLAEVFFIYGIVTTTKKLLSTNNLENFF